MGGGGCCVGDCGFCCIGDCGFCCVFKCSDCGDCCVGHCSDNPAPRRGGSSGGGYVEDPTAKHAALIANELAEMRKRATEESKKDETDCLKDIDENIDYFVKLLEEINQKKFGGRSLNLNIDQIRKINEKLHDEVVGSIGKTLDSRLVTTDKELSVILEERDNSKRKQNFDDFYRRIRREAIRALIEKIETSVRKQSESIEREIQNRLNEVKNNMDEETRALEELQKLKANEDSRIAEKQIEYMYYEDLCDIMYDNLKISSIGR